MSSNRIDKMERKFGRYAIRNLSLYFVITEAVGYLLGMIPGGYAVMQYLTLEPALILRGQIWRIFTWVLCGSPNENIFWIAISLYFYYSIGNTLETVWGSYRYNVYMFSGLIFTVIGAFVMYGIFRLVGLQPLAIRLGDYFTTYYICMSIFLAFAATFPEMRISLMFVIPIKVKVLGIIYAVMMLVECLQGGLLVAIPIVASLMNFIIFFFTGRKRIGISREQQRERNEFRAKMKAAAKSVTRHKCAICGKTEVSDPDLEFRFCSKCNGNYEYCENHIFTHQHIN